MKNITIIIPIHEYKEENLPFLKNALNSVVKNQETYTYGELTLMLTGPSEVLEKVKNGLKDFENIITSCPNNTGKTDFCSQVNFAAENVATEYFSILEIDDLYADNWFEMAHEYYYTNESVSLFMPINVLADTNYNQYQFLNEIAWTNSFSNEIGFLDYDCLNDYVSFNLTGGIFNTSDFIKIGGFKSSLKASFSYEFLLRLTRKELKVYVVPKEGYVHMVGREGSLTDTYNKTMSQNEIEKWFELAKTECVFKEDRNITVDTIKEENLK